jgi:hypothetical protein
LHFVRDLLALRRELEDLRVGQYERVAVEGRLWAWRRGRSVVVAVNLGDAPAAVAGVTGTLAIATDRARDGEAVNGRLALGPWQGAVVTLTPPSM